MTIKTATLNGVATIEIARPEKKNAITQAMYLQLAAAFDAAREDKAVRAVLLTGQPGIFTSGNDIDDFVQAPGRSSTESPSITFMKALIGCDKPVVAAVTGAAIGIGTTMLLHCDFVYVSDEARLAMPFVSLGLVPEFASSLIVPQLMGNVRAAEKLLLGDPFTGAEAVECGIANAVLPASEVVKHARRVAERFNALPPGAVRETKRLLRRGRPAALLEETIGVEGKAFGAAPAKPRSQGGVQRLLREAQARLHQVLRCRDQWLIRPRPWRSRSRSRRCSSPRRSRPGAARRCCPRRPGRAKASLAGDGSAPLRVLVAGDSSAAGVGVADQEQSVIGHFVRSLHRATGRPIAWALRARTGLTTRGVHELLAGSPPFAADVAIVITGVNDVIDQVSTRRALRDRAALADWLLGTGVGHVVFAPLAADGSLPAPARAAAPRDGRRRASPRRRAGTLGGDAQRRLASGVRGRARRRRHGERRFSPRRAGLSRLRRGARGACRRAGAAVTSPLRWRVGDVTITRIVESGGASSPLFASVPPTFLFSNLSAETVRSQAWLQPHFATANGRLIASIHAFVVESRGKTIVVDTCVGNDKVRELPAWSGLSGPFLADFAAAGFALDGVDAVLCTHLHSDHVGWNTRLADGRWVPTFPRARYLLSRLDYDGLAASDDANSREVLADSIAPVLDAGLVDWVDSSPRDHRRGSSRADARPYARPRQRSHPLGGRRGGDHRRPDASPDPVLRPARRVALQRRFRAGVRDPDALPARAGRPRRARPRHALRHADRRAHRLGRRDLAFRRRRGGGLSRLRFSLSGSAADGPGRRSRRR